MKDYYQVLGIKRSASADEIRKAYLKLAKQYHPDVNAQKAYYEERFKTIQEAYTILSDFHKKQNYDRQWIQAHTPKPPPTYRPSKPQATSVNWATEFRRQQGRAGKKSEMSSQEKRRHLIATIISIVSVAVIVPIILIVFYIVSGGGRWAWILILVFVIGGGAYKFYRDYQKFQNKS